MCFSPDADFGAAAVVGTVGVATLRQVRAPKEFVIGALPLLFAAHQFTEAFVWLGLRGDVSASVGNTATELYLIYAQAVLPIIVPIGFFLLEPSAKHRRWIWPFIALGACVGAYLLWQVTQYPISAQADARCVAYTTNTPNGDLLALLYVTATCGPALLSSRRYLQWFGLANLGGVVAASFMRDTEFTSLWCVYAAFASVLIFVHFRKQRGAEVPTPRNRMGVPAPT